MTPDQNFSSADSLALIQRMITQAKEDFADHSFHPLWWGWLVAVAALLCYGMIQLGLDRPWLPWAVLLPIGGIGAFVYNFRRGAQLGPRAGRSAINQSMGYLWGSIGAALGIATAVLFKIGFQPAYIFFICLYGVGTVTTGGIIRFWPLQLGGWLTFIIAAVALFVKGPTLLLLLALALLVSYIIPGHLLRAQSRRKLAQYQQAAAATPSYV